MDAVNLSTLGTAPGSAADESARPSSVESDRCMGRTARGEFDGLTWTSRNGFDLVLAVVPAAAWAHPERQDWQRVKHNATREVWRATIGGATYYLKYYAQRGWRDALKRVFRDSPCRVEWDSGLYALRAGVPVVSPAGYASRLRRAGGCCALLVTEAVEPAYPLNEFWQTLQSDDASGRRRRDTVELIERLAEMIARAHQAGFEHLDMHAANILVQAVGARRYRTVFVDVQSARQGMPVRDRAVVRNLAQLNQWFRRHSRISDRLRFLRAYLRWRNEYETAFVHARPLRFGFEALVRALVVAAERHAERLWARRDRRVLRSGRYFSRVRVPGGWRGSVFLRCKQPLQESRASHLALDRQWWQQQLRDPLRWFRREAGAACKNSHSAMVGRTILAHERENVLAIVKRPLARNWRRRVRQVLPPSRAARGWRMGNALLNRNVATARPLAYLERRFGPFVRDSVLITEAVPGALDLKAHLRRQFEQLPANDWLGHKRELCELLVRHVRRLQDRGFAHRDCKAENILVVTQPELKLLWIDMDGLRHIGALGRRRQMMPLVRLHVSLCDVPGLTRTDRVRFLKSYLARFGSDARAWRDVWRELTRAVEAKVRTQAARRAWKLKHYGRA